MHIGLIIWGLEGTLFGGSPGNGQDGAVVASRAALIRAFNDYGVASTVCAETNGTMARVRLEQAGLWDEFVLPRLDRAICAETVRAIMADLGLTPGEVLLVHSDPRALHAARALMPDLRILNAGGGDADAILEAILVARRRPWKTRADIALLFGDQTKGIAQYSRLRARIDEGAAVRRFALSDMISGPLEEMNLPPALVYGAGIDYVDARWPDLAFLLDDEGLLEACIHLFCERVTAAKARMLVVLPSAGDLLIPTVSLRRRTIRFNAAWRDAAQCRANIEILDMPQAPPGSALQLKCLAAAIDDWADGARFAQAKVA